MAYSYPIWHDVQACNYKSSKSYGSKNTAQTNVYVGTSAKNSELLVTHTTTRREIGDYIVFKFGVDLNDGKGLQVLKTMYMHAKSKEWFNEKPLDLVA